MFNKYIILRFVPFAIGYNLGLYTISSEIFLC